MGFPGVPSGAYKEHLDNPEPYRAEPVSILDVQMKQAQVDAQGFAKHIMLKQEGGSNVTTTKMKPVDAVVVGSGVVGSIMSMELANAGLKVLCLERGRMIDPQTDFVAPYVHDELNATATATFSRTCRARRSPSATN